MAQGAFLSTASLAAFCLILLGACSTDEELPPPVVATPVQQARPLPPPAEAPKSRLLIAAASPEADEAEESTEAPESAPESEPATPSAPIPRPPAPSPPAAEVAVPPAPPQKPQASAPTSPVEEATPPEAEEVSQMAEEASTAPEPSSEQADPPQEDDGGEQSTELEEIEIEDQQAVLPPGDAPERLRLQFQAGEVELTEAMQDQLLQVAQQLRTHEEERIQLLAYASGYEEDISRARRLSLARALAVRAFLLDQGIRSTRMDVRALARSEGNAPADRVDVVPQGE